MEWYSLSEASKKTGCPPKALRGYLKQVPGWKRVRTLFGEEVRISSEALRAISRLVKEEKPQAPETHREAETGQNDKNNTSGTKRIAPEVILERYEQAIYRVGWLEGQLESHKKLLSDGQHTMAERESEIRRDLDRVGERERESEARLSEARALEGKHREERLEWEKRLATQAEKIHEKELECEKERDRARKISEETEALHRRIESLEQQRAIMTEENDLLMRQKEAIQSELEGTRKKRFKLW